MRARSISASSREIRQENIVYKETEIELHAGARYFSDGGRRGTAKRPNGRKEEIERDLKEGSLARGTAAYGVPFRAASSRRRRQK